MAKGLSVRVTCGCRRRIELVQDLDFPAACNRLKLTPDGQYLFASGTHAPRVRPSRRPRRLVPVCRRHACAACAVLLRRTWCLAAAPCLLWTACVAGAPCRCCRRAERTRPCAALGQR